MLRFEYPNHLYLFLVLILLILVHYYAAYRRRSKLKAFGEKDLIKNLLIDVSAWKPEVKFWLCMLALSMFIIAYARPQFGTKMDKPPSSIVIQRKSKPRKLKSIFSTPI